MSADRELDLDAVAHNVFTPIGVLDHEKGYFAIVRDALPVWGAAIWRGP